MTCVVRDPDAMRFGNRDEAALRHCLLSAIVSWGFVECGVHRRSPDHGGRQLVAVRHRRSTARPSCKPRRDRHDTYINSGPNDSTNSAPHHHSSTSCHGITPLLRNSSLSLRLAAISKLASEDMDEPKRAGDGSANSRTPVAMRLRRSFEILVILASISGRRER